MSLSIFCGVTDNINSRSTDTNNDSSVKNRTSVYAGNMNQDMNQVDLKREKAQKQAWKVVSDAWNSDKEIDDSINQRKLDYLEKQQEKVENQKYLDGTNEEMKMIKAEYAVDPDSQEQKDLELLMRKQDFDKGLTQESFTQEELERIACLTDDNLTDYQKAALDINDRAGKFKSDIKDAEAHMMDDMADIRSIKIERLKVHTMIDAGKEADSIMEAANKEIIGMLVEEAKEHIDDKQKEEEEKAEKVQEQKEEREERLEELEEKMAVEEALILKTKESVEEAEKKEQERNMEVLPEIDDILELTNSSSTGSTVSQSLQEIKNSMKLLEADLKGIKVDESL